MATWLNRWLRRVPVWLVWLPGLIPLALLIADALTGGLGVEPVRDIEHRLGRTALYFLVASLAVTPLLRLTRVNLIRYRRTLGLLCFTYAALHMLAWVSMDMAFLWAQMGRDLIKRPYLFFGMAGFAILLALAVTSNDRAIRSMGAGWRRLHRLIYVAAPLVVLHWIWALKTFPVIPMIWMGVILGLLLMRLASRRSATKRVHKRII